MKPNHHYSFILFLFSAIWVKLYSRDVFVTPYKTCGNNCMGDLITPFDNLLFALRNVSITRSTTSIILLGNASTEHFLLPREINQLTPSSLLYDFSDKIKLAIEDLEVRPLFCDELIVQTNRSLTDKCINRDQALTIVFKPIEITLTIVKKLSIKNIIFDWSESSQSVNASQTCTKIRKRCCKTKDILDGINCNPKFYTNQPGNVNGTFNFIELGSDTEIGKVLLFDYISLKYFRNKSLRSFVQTNGNGSFNLTLQNSIIDDVSFGQGLLNHNGTGKEVYNSSINLLNISFTKYNYWNREEDKNFSSWKEGYLLWAEKNFKGSISIVNSTFFDMNAASLYVCDIYPILSNYFRNYPMSRSDIWTRYHNRNSSDKESSVIFINRLDGDLVVKKSTFQKIIGLYGAVVQVRNCSDSSTFTFVGNKFDDNFAMQGFSNLLIVAGARHTNQQAKCPLVRVENSDFINTKGCPGSYGNVGFICYLDSMPANSSSFTNVNSSYLTYQAYKDTIFHLPQVKVTNSSFLNNLIPVSNSLVIIGSYFTSLTDNRFEDNGGTTAEIALYSLNNSNFLEKKPYQYFDDRPQDQWEIYYGSTYFGQSSAVFLDRIFKLESIRNVFQGNWGPWEGSQVLAAALTIRSWIPIRSGFLKFKDDKYIDHSGIPPRIAEYLVQNGTFLKNNSYIPPLITIGFNPKDAVKFYEVVNESYILFDGVEFRNNTLSLDIDGGCLYNSVQLERICTLMKNKKRYLTGLVKFLSESELGEESSVDFISTTQQHEMTFSMVNSKITNNTLLSEGCLFSTLWAEKYSVYNLTIQDNKINALAAPLMESAENSGPFLDLPKKNRNGVFCAFKKETINGFIDGILFTAANLKVVNNTGTIFNLYPSELNNFFLFNSIFLNNSVPYGSLVSVFQTSKVITKNNFFIQNTDALGIFFLTSFDASHESLFNSYLENNGKHSSVAYINDKAQVTEILSKQNGNCVNPTFLTFADNDVPQGGLYFVELAQLSLVLSEFKQNNLYAGLVISQKSTISFDLTNISDHTISGNSIIGNIYSSILDVRGLKVTNNSLHSLPSFNSAPAIIKLDKTKFNADVLEIYGTNTLNQGTFLVGTKIEGTLKNIRFKEFYSVSQNSLIRLDFSHMLIQNMVCSHISSLLKLSETKLTLLNVFVEKLRLSSNSEFLINMIDTTLEVEQFEYIGAHEGGDYFSLITGSNNQIKIVEAQFLNAVKGISNIFELTNSHSFFITRSRFHYTDDYVQTLIFDLSSSKQIIITKCLFILTGQVIHAENVFNSFYFIGNSIITNSHEQNVKIVGSNRTYFVDNYLLRHKNNFSDSLPESQVHFLNCFGAITIQENCFTSLYSTKAVLKAEGIAHPYYINTSKNLFIENTGVNGGAIHLDASLSSLPNEMPTAIIDGSVFILNKAINSEGLRGKGGAIFQTTSTLIKQETRIEKSCFISNSAEAIGGALFFDYLPFKVDAKSQFKENYANRLNHIGSYPVKLSYYEKTPEKSEPFLPNQSVLEESLSSKEQDLIKWENIASGLQTNQTYIFGLVDMFGQTVYDDNTSSLELYPEGLAKEKIPYFSSILSIQAHNGLYFLSNFKFSYKIDEDFNVTFISSAIQNQRLIPLDVPLIPTSSLKVQIHFRNCSRGEIVLEKQDIEICSECQSGLWQTSLIPNSLACKECDDKSTICLGGDNTGPKRGYWRFNETADIVLECPTPSSCLGNEITNQLGSLLLDPIGKCEYGYKGNLCSNCISGWAKTATGSCTDCEANTWFYFRVALTLIIQLIFIVQGFRETMNLCKEYSESKVMKLNGAILIRILTNYLQLISLVSAIPVTWPSLLTDISEVIFQISSINQNIFTIDCLFHLEEVYGIKMVFIELLFETTGGFVLSSLSVIFWFLYYTIKKKRILRSKNFVNNIITTIIVICFMMQPSAIQSSFSFFQCTNLYREDNPIRYFSKDYDVICWEGDHLYWTFALGLPSLVIWVFVLPFIVFNQIRKNKNKLNSKEIAKKYCFLYGGYTHSKYYWELVIMIRKFIFIGVIIAASFYSTDLEIYLSIFLISFFYFIHSISTPFSSPQLNFLEKISLISALAINFCGLYFQFFSLTPVLLDILIISIGLISNMIFLIAFARIYFYIQIIKLKEKPKFNRIITKITKKLDFCFKHLKIDKFFIKLEFMNKLDTPDQTITLQKFNSDAKTDINSPNGCDLISKKHLLQARQTTGECSILNDLSSSQEKDNFAKINQMITHPLQTLSSRREPKKDASKKQLSHHDFRPQEGLESFTKFDDLSINQEECNDDPGAPLTSNRRHNFLRMNKTKKGQTISSAKTI